MNPTIAWIFGGWLFLILCVTMYGATHLVNRAQELHRPITWDYYFANFKKEPKLSIWLVGVILFWSTLFGLVIFKGLEC